MKLTKLLSIFALLALLPVGAWAQTTTNYQMSAAGIATGISFAGEWEQQSGVSLQGHTMDYFQGSINQINFQATGTQCVINGFDNAAGQTLNVTVDGTAVVITPTTTYGPITLFTGLADAPHNVQINEPYGEVTWLDYTNTIDVTGAAPSLQYSPGYGLVYAVSTNLSDFQFAPSPWTSKPMDNTYAVYCYSPTWYGDRVRFNVNAQEVKVYVTGNPMAAELNDQIVNYFSPVANGSSTWATLATGLNPQVTNALSLISEDGDQGGPSLCFVMTVGGTLDAAPAARPLYAFYGTSISVSVQTTQIDGGPPVTYTNGQASGGVLFTGYPNVFGEMNHVNIAPRGYGGTSCVATGSSADGGAGSPYAGVNRTADITSLSPAPTGCVVEYITNDMPGGTYNAGTMAAGIASFKSAYLSMLQSLVAGDPNTKFLCLGAFQREQYDPLTVAAYNNAAQQDIVTVNSGNVKYQDTTGWLNGDFTTDYQPGGIHPNQSGSYKIAKQLTADFQNDWGLLQKATPGRGRTLH